MKKNRKAEVFFNMNYQSTRNAALTASSAEAILNGLAPDGGLYAMPASRGWTSTGSAA